MTNSTETNSFSDHDAIYELTESGILENEQSEQNKNNKRAWKRRAGLLFFFLVVVFFSWFISRLEWYLTDSSKIPMAELIVQGERKYVTDDDIRNVLLKEPAITNYFSVDVDSVQLKIESLPWVYKASIRKIWPDSLRIYIQEQPVIAFWNDKRLLNDHGIVFDANIMMAPESLVKLYGPNDRIELVLNKYRALNSLLASNGYVVSAVRLNLRNALIVELADGITMRLGREDMIARVQRYIDFVSVLDKDRIEYVDLRYDTGFSVGWKKNNL